MYESDRRLLLGRFAFSGSRTPHCEQQSATPAYGGVSASFGHDGGETARRFSSPWPIDEPIKRATSPGSNQRIIVTMGHVRRCRVSAGHGGNAHIISTVAMHRR